MGDNNKTREDEAFWEMNGLCITLSDKFENKVGKQLPTLSISINNDGVIKIMIQTETLEHLNAITQTLGKGKFGFSKGEGQHAVRMPSHMFYLKKEELERFLRFNNMEEDPIKKILKYQNVQPSFILKDETGDNYVNSVTLDNGIYAINGTNNAGEPRSITYDSNTKKYAGFNGSTNLGIVGDQMAGNFNAILSHFKIDSPKQQVKESAEAKAAEQKTAETAETAETDFKNKINNAKSLTELKNVISGYKGEIVNSAGGKASKDLMGKYIDLLISDKKKVASIANGIPPKDKFDYHLVSAHGIYNILLALAKEQHQENLKQEKATAEKAFKANIAKANSLTELAAVIEKYPFDILNSQKALLNKEVMANFIKNLTPDKIKKISEAKNITSEEAKAANLTNNFGIGQKFIQLTEKQHQENLKQEKAATAKAAAAKAAADKAAATITIEKVAVMEQRKPDKDIAPLLANQDKINIRCPENVLKAFQELVLNSTLPGATVYNSYSKKTETLPSDPKDFTARHLQMLARNETANVTGIMKTELYGDTLTPNQIATLRCLVKQTTVSGLVNIGQMGGFPAKYDNNDFLINTVVKKDPPEKVLIIDQSGLQWQGDLRNTGGMFFYPSNDVGDKYPDYNQWQNTTYQAMYGLERPNKASANSVEITWVEPLPDNQQVNHKGKLDLTQVAMGIQFEFLHALQSAATQGEVELGPNDKINLRYCKAGMGFFAEGIHTKDESGNYTAGKDNPILLNTRLDGIKNALLYISQLSLEDRQKFLGKVKRLELPFSEGAAFEKKLGEIKSLSEKIGLEWGGAGFIDALASAPEGYINATTTGADPHAAPGNEGTVYGAPGSLDAMISVNGSTEHLNAAQNKSIQCSELMELAPAKKVAPAQAAPATLAAVQTQIQNKPPRARRFKKFTPEELKNTLETPQQKAPALTPTQMQIAAIKQILTDYAEVRKTPGWDLVPGSTCELGMSGQGKTIGLATAPGQSGYVFELAEGKVICKDKSNGFKIVNPIPAEALAALPTIPERFQKFPPIERIQCSILAEKVNSFCGKHVSVLSAHNENLKTFLTPLSSTQQQPNSAIKAQLIEELNKLKESLFSLPFIQQKTLLTFGHGLTIEEHLKDRIGVLEGKIERGEIGPKTLSASEQVLLTQFKQDLQKLKSDLGVQEGNVKKYKM